MFALGSVKGAPGVTTLTMATALAMADPSRMIVVIEADPQGGSLAPRLDLSYEPGLTSLAAIRGAGLSSEQVWDHAQPVASGVRVLTGPPGPEQANAALRTLGDRFATVLAAMPPNVYVVVDLGRLSRQSAALPLAIAATATAVVCRMTLDAVHHLPAVVPTLVDAGIDVELIAIGDKPFVPTEVADHVDVPLLAVVPDEPKQAPAAATGALTTRAARRSLYARVVAEIGEQFVTRRPATDAAPAAQLDEAAPSPGAANVGDPTGNGAADAGQGPPGEAPRRGAEHA